MKRVALFFAALLAYAGMAIAGVNINNATKEQLESLDGVGPVKAQAIIDYRTKNGNFKSLEDVKKVNGVGDATFEKMKKDISLTGATTPLTKTQQVKDKAADAKAATKEAAQDVKAGAKEAAADTKAAAKDTKEKVKEKAADTKAAVKEKAADTKAAVKEGARRSRPPIPRRKPRSRPRWRRRRKPTRRRRKRKRRSNKIALRSTKPRRARGFFFLPLMHPTLEQFVGNTPLVRLQRIPGNTTNTLLAKLEGNNPAGSVKDRPALAMIVGAEKRGEIKPGATLIEATSGNTGIALAMVAAMRGYRMVLVMPEHLSVERRQTMAAFGAQFVLTPEKGGMELARDTAERMRDAGEGVILDQFANPDNPLAHYTGTGPEIWRDTQGKITHFVATMGTTGTIMGCSRFLKEKNPAIRVIGVQPAPGAQVPGIRKWPEDYLPKIFDRKRVDLVMEVSQEESEEMTRRLAREEGIFAGISSGGGLAAAMRVSAEVRDAVIVHVVADRGDRYLSTGVFPT